MRYILLFFIFITPFLWSDVKSTSGQIQFDVDSDGQSELTLNGSGLGIGKVASSNLDVSGNGIVSGQLFVGGDSGSSNLNIHGSLAMNFQTVAATTTLSGNSIVLADSSNGNLILSLPDASSVPNRKYTIKKTSPLNRVFIRDGGYIDNYSDLTLSVNAMGSVSLISHSGNWSILSLTDEGLNVASDNLVGWWKLDETSGNTTTDYSLYGRSSSTTGSMNFIGNGIDAVIDRGLDLDGANYVAIENDTDLPMGNEDRTVMAWIRPAAYGTQNIITWGVNTGGQRMEYGIRGGGQFVFAVNGGAYGTSSVPAAGNWFHACIVFSGTNVGDVLIYINGVSETTSLVAGSNRTVITASNGQAQVGINVDRDASHYTGDIDDIRIYNRVLSSAEVQAIFQQGY